MFYTRFIRDANRYMYTYCLILILSTNFVSQMTNFMMTARVVFLSRPDRRQLMSGQKLRRIITVTCTEKRDCGEQQFTSIGRTGVAGDDRGVVKTS